MCYNFLMNNPLYPFGDEDENELTQSIHEAELMNDTEEMLKKKKQFNNEEDEDDWWSEN